MKDKQWKDICGYEGIYQVSSDGVVKRVIRGRKYNKPRRLIPEKRKGYLRVQLFKNGRRRKEYVHRLVAMSFISNPKNLPEVNHKNHVRHDNTVNNLEWSTEEDNKIDLWIHELTKRGYKIEKPELSPA